MAAVLACGPGTVVSHMSAAALWGFLRPGRGPIEVTAPGRRTRPGVLAHQSRYLPAAHVTSHLGIPVTTAARTLVDICSRLDDRALARAVNDARLGCHVTLDQLERVLASLPKRKGVERLRALIAHGGAPTRSVFEDRFRRLIERAGLPRPEINQRVAGHEVDALWRKERLVVELDGLRYHASAQDFERDRARDADLVDAGYRVVRITWRRLAADSTNELRRLRRLLDRRRA